ncbi:MAG: hypothetical protein JWM33_1275 [Caulobacteraceae bacterium]|nr:hypothetical protein [Caulobacteraceae bacterium]
MDQATHPHFVVTDDFFDGADDCREAFDDHFRRPHAQGPAHQVWNYWYVPGAYTYLRTNAAKVIGQPLTDRFMLRLNAWALETLGLSTRQEPWLGLYIDGCSQTIHNDAAAGQMGFVFSLTHWTERHFLGGETLLFHPTNYWQTDRVRIASSSTVFYDLVPAHFNRLLVFDDRVIHGVQTVQGTMDPRAGRLVMHGHLRALSVGIQGALTPERAMPALEPGRGRLVELMRQNRDQIDGFATFRLHVDAEGRVVQARPLCDRFLPLTPDLEIVETFRQALLDLFSGTRFPPANGESQVTLPVTLRPGAVAV